MRPLIAKWLRAAARWIDQPDLKSVEIKHNLICDGVIVAVKIPADSVFQKDKRSSSSELSVAVSRFKIVTRKCKAFRLPSCFKGRIGK